MLTRNDAPSFASCTIGCSSLALALSAVVEGDAAGAPPAPAAAAAFDFGDLTFFPDDLPLFSSAAVSSLPTPPFARGLVADAECPFAPFFSTLPSLDGCDVAETGLVSSLLSALVASDLLSAAAAAAAVSSSSASASASASSCCALVSESNQELGVRAAQQNQDKKSRSANASKTDL